jgi:YidC/Oxa1 family membrane protein insertase
VLGFYILHEGLIGVFDGTLVEVDYDDLRDKGEIRQETTGGWLGITDKYWLVALLPDQQQTVNTRFAHGARSGDDKYQADLLYDAIAVPPGGSTEITSRVFAGAKEVLLLDKYEERYNITSFWKAVDFGWFFFLTYPMFYAMHWLHEVFGNFGVAILMLTVGIKIVFFPLANKSYVSMAKMRKLQPKMIELRERYSDDKQRLNQAMMELYKKEGANPLSGCLPILIQIPVFFSLYKVLFVSIEMRQAPFFGWIQDLSAPDPTSWINGFGLLPWGVPELGAFDVVSLGVWPILMGLTMFFQMRLNPQPPDPVQAKIFAAARSGSGQDFRLHADHLHLFAGEVSGRARHLLDLEQPPVHGPADRDHETRRRPHRARGDAKEHLNRSGCGRTMGDDAHPHDGPDLEAGRLLFAQQCRFHAGVADETQIPHRRASPIPPAAHNRSTSSTWVPGWPLSICRAMDLPVPPSHRSGNGRGWWSVICVAAASWRAFACSSTRATASRTATVRSCRFWTLRRSPIRSC